MVKEKSVYDLVKKQNGEAFAKAIRNFDASIFEIPNILQIVKFAGRKAEPIIPFLRSLKKQVEEEQGPYENPITLLKKAGYDAFVADTEEKKNSIAHLYAKGEEICTLTDPNRHKKYYIIHAIKEGADKLNRKDFSHPARQDKYGTSVISIQILKTGGFISIKNRYNHTVSNCDNTFDSNPDNIISGLSLSLKRFFKVDFLARDDFLPKNYVYQNAIYHYHTERENIYFGDGFYVKDGVVFEVDKNSQLMADGFVIDLKKKDVLTPLKSERGSLIALKKEIKDKTLQVKSINGVKILLADGKEVMRIQKGNIISLTLQAQYVEDHSFNIMDYLIEFNAPNLKNFSARMFGQVPNLKKVNIPVCEFVSPYTFEKCPKDVQINMSKMNEKGYYQIGNIIISTNTYDNFVQSTYALNAGLHEILNAETRGKKISVIQTKGEIHIQLDGNDFITAKNGKISSLCLKSVESFKGRGACWMLGHIEKLEMPNLEVVNDYILEYLEVDYFKAPKLKKVGNSCFERVKKIEAPNLEEIGRCSLTKLDEEDEQYFPKLKEIGYHSCSKAKIYAPKLEKIDVYSRDNRSVGHLNLGKNHAVVRKILSETDLKNTRLLEVVMDQVKKANSIEIKNTTPNAVQKDTMLILDGKEVLQLGTSLDHRQKPEEAKPVLQKLCLSGVTHLESETIKGFSFLCHLSLPDLKEMGPENVKDCPNLFEVSAPNLKKAGDNCFNHLKKVQTLILPHLEQVREHCFRNLEEVKCIDVPKLKSAGEKFLRHTDYLEHLYAPKLKNRLEHIKKHPNCRTILRDMDEANTKRDKKPVSFFRTVLHKDGIFKN